MHPSLLKNLLLKSLRDFLRLLGIYFSKNKQLYQSLKNILGFYPGNISLYKSAFRHKSAAHKIKEGVKDSNERLEFLGDAILSAVVADYLFKKFPYKDEGFLTKMRSKIVSRSQLNQLAVKLGIKELVESSLDKGGKNISINGDAFEALIGAIYLDKGYTTASNFILHRFIQHHIDIDEIETKENDFKSKMIEWAQKEKKRLQFRFEEITVDQEKQYIIQLIIDNEVFGKGQHFSKKRAEQIAAEEACIRLELLTHLTQKFS